MERNQWGKKYLQLEQGMMFLGLANYLHDGIVRKLFTSDPLIRKGIELSKPFIHHDPKLVARWAERDSQAIKKTPLRLASKWADTVDSVTALDLAGMVIHQPKLLSVRPDNGMVHLASSGGGDWAQTVVGIPGNGMDISNLDRIEVDVDNLQGNTPQPGYIKMFLVDKFGQSRYAYLKLNSKATHYSIPARDVYGFLMDNDKLAYVNLTFDRRPAFRPNMRFHPSDFSMRLKAIRLITKK